MYLCIHYVVITNCMKSKILILVWLLMAQHLHKIQWISVTWFKNWSGEEGCTKRLKVKENTSYGSLLIVMTSKPECPYIYVYNATITFYNVLQKFTTKVTYLSKMYKPYTIFERQIKRGWFHSHLTNMCLLLLAIVKVKVLLCLRHITDCWKLKIMTLEIPPLLA
jgi:hypothetical protein